MGTRFLAAIILPAALLAVGCSGSGQRSSAVVRTPPATLNAIVASPTAAAPPAALSSSALSALSSLCPLSTPAKRQQWVDQLRTAKPNLGLLPEAQDEDFLHLSVEVTGDGVPVPLSYLVSHSSVIAVLRVVSTELDSKWSEYSGQYVPKGQYFGVAGRSQLAIDQMLKGDEGNIGKLLTRPFFIVADDHCHPVVPLGFNCCTVTLTLPVFQGERGIIFASSSGDAPVVLPIVQGRMGRPVLPYDTGYSYIGWKPAMTGQEFIDAVRGAIASSAAAPGTSLRGDSDGSLYGQSDQFVGRNVSGADLPIRSSPRVVLGNIVGTLPAGSTIAIQGEVTGEQAEPGQGYMWYVVGPNQYVYGSWYAIERQP